MCLTRPDEDYGFIRTDDGREIYFHRNALVNADLGALEDGVRAARRFVAHLRES